MHRVTVDAELGGELLDPAAGPVGRHQLSDALKVEALLGLLRRALVSRQSPCLGQLVGAAQRDDHLAVALADFTAGRREELRTLLERGQTRGELPVDADLPTLVDLVYGFLWYRLLVNHAPLDRRAARDLTNAVLAAAS